MWVNVRVILGEDESFFGPGPRAILEEIEKTGSMKAAAANMKISYNKILRLIRRTEKELGFAVVTTNKGGKSFGGTELTEKGKQLLAAYILINDEISKSAEEIFKKQFPFYKESES